MNDYRRDVGACGVRRRFPVGPAGVATILVAMMLPSAASAAIDSETQFVLSSFSFLVWGALVMWMCAGFTMLEAGSVRTKNASVICLKNIGLYSIAVLTAIIYPIVGSWTWGGGWLSAMGFQDFAGSTIVHSTGGWAAPASRSRPSVDAGNSGSNERFDV